MIFCTFVIRLVFSTSFSSAFNIAGQDVLSGVKNFAATTVRDLSVGVSCEETLGENERVATVETRVVTKILSKSDSLH